MAATDTGGLWQLLRRRIESEINACNSLYDVRIWELDAGDSEVRVAAAADLDDYIAVLFDAETGEVTCRFGCNTLAAATDAAKIRMDSLRSVEDVLTRLLNALRFPD